MRPASLVAWRCWSLKCAGTVITALLHGWPRATSALRLSSVSTMADTSWGESWRDSPRHCTSSMGRSWPPLTTLNGKRFTSFCTT